MTTPRIGQPAPVFTLHATGGQTLSLSDLKGKNLVLYFYPRDSTPGCTIEGQEFRDLYPEFQKLNTVILGVSRDRLQSHEKFKGTHAFPFELLSDEDEQLCRLYDVIKEKNMYGKKVLGIERSTFLIDTAGVLRQEWRKVKVAGHAAAVLEAVKHL